MHKKLTLKRGKQPTHLSNTLSRGVKKPDPVTRAIKAVKNSNRRSLQKNELKRIATEQRNVDAQLRSLDKFLKRSALTRAEYNILQTHAKTIIERMKTEKPRRQTGSLYGLQLIQKEIAQMVGRKGYSDKKVVDQYAKLMRKKIELSVRKDLFEEMK